MAENQTKEKREYTKAVFSKVLNKMNPNGTLKRSYLVEIKPYELENGTKGHFLSLSRDDPKFGNRPAKSSSVVFDPLDDELWQILGEAREFLSK